MRTRESPPKLLDIQCEPCGFEAALLDEQIAEWQKQPGGPSFHDLERQRARQQRDAEPLTLEIEVLVVRAPDLAPRLAQHRQELRLVQMRPIVLDGTELRHVKKPPRIGTQKMVQGLEAFPGGMPDEHPRDGAISGP